MEGFNKFAHFMYNVGELKKLKRAGWVRSGIENPESVSKKARIATRNDKPIVPLPMIPITFSFFILLPKAHGGENYSIKLG